MKIIVNNLFYSLLCTEWLLSNSGFVRKIPFPPGFDPQTVQPVVSHYTVYAIPHVEESDSDLILVTIQMSFWRN
jgi:hypothetical protein